MSAMSAATHRHDLPHNPNSPNAPNGPSDSHDDEPSTDDLRRIERDQQQRQQQRQQQQDEASSTDDDASGALRGSLETYLTAITAAYRPLTLQEQRAAWQRGDRAALVSSALPLVIWLVKEALRRDLQRDVAIWWTFDVEELVAAGNVGLVEASQRYDARRGFAFTTYATYWVRKCIMRELAAQRLQRVHSTLRIDEVGREEPAPDLILPDHDHDHDHDQDHDQDQDQGDGERREVNVVAPVVPLHHRSRALGRDLAALRSARLLDDQHVALLALVTGARHPDPAWIPPRRWCAGMPHSQRAVADLLAVHHTTIGRQLASIEGRLTHTTQSTQSTQAQAQAHVTQSLIGSAHRILDALIAPLPKVRLLSRQSPTPLPNGRRSRPPRAALPAP